MTYAVAIASDGDKFVVTNNAVDSDGNPFASLSNNALDSDGNSFVIFGTSIDAVNTVAFITTVNRTFRA
jgi:hypothetical protein